MCVCARAREGVAIQAASMCLCTASCMPPCMYARKRTQACMHACMHAWIHGWIRGCTCACIYIYIRMHACMHACMHGFMDGFVHVRVRVYMCIYIYINININMHACIYACIYLCVSKPQKHNADVPIISYHAVASTLSSSLRTAPQASSALDELRKPWRARYGSKLPSGSKKLCTTRFSMTRGPCTVSGC